MGISKLKTQNSKLKTQIFDEAFLRRVERLNFRTVPSLRGVMVGERRSRHLRPALDFSDHRPYTPGDDLRHVDWHVYARSDDLFVKLGEATQGIDVHLLLDASPSMAWKPPWPTDPPVDKWRAVCRLAGALAYLALSGGERVHLTPFAGQLAAGFGPTHGKRRAVAALRFLAELAVQPPADASGPDTLAQCLAGYARRHPGGGLLVLISDLFNAGQDAAALSEGLRNLPPPRWQVVVMHFVSQQELAPTVDGDVELVDVETAEAGLFHLDETTLSQYRLRVRRWLHQLEQTCARRGAAYARVLAEWPFEQAVIPYLRQRGVVQ